MAYQRDDRALHGHVKNPWSVRTEGERANPLAYFSRCSHGDLAPERARGAYGRSGHRGLAIQKNGYVRLT
jgi:hypothetical protein